ncbi:MAG: pyruvate ferredoxin oxidoreductase [Anaerotruncus sp.]|nr:pyruvate ferredoxin oxidoreductase [Anaerotruncus sp.]
MNTGIQRSSSTPFGASTTTSPAGKASIGPAHAGRRTWPQIAVAHNIPYVATACSSLPLRPHGEGEEGGGDAWGRHTCTSCSVCPTGWRMPPQDAIKYGRLAVDTCVFPLYEVVNGKYRLTVPASERSSPSRITSSGQGRFRHLTDEAHRADPGAGGQRTTRRS